MTAGLVGRKAGSACQDLKGQAIGEEICKFWKRPWKNLLISPEETGI